MTVYIKLCLVCCLSPTFPFLQMHVNSCVNLVLLGNLLDYHFKSLDKSNVPFEIIHPDLWGPFPSLAFEGYRYYLTLLDECTRHTWIFPLMNKREVFHYSKLSVLLFPLNLLPLLKFCKLMGR